MRKIIIMIGPPGSGKGTQAKKIAAKYDYGHISTGDLIRTLDARQDLDNADREIIANTVKKGLLAPDEFIYRLAFKEIEKYLAQGRGVVLDGAIRNVSQAEEFQKFFDSKKLSPEVLAVEISLSNQDAYNRLTRRRVCSNCGEIIPWLPETKDLRACPKCGGNLTMRQDDDPEVIKKRIIEQGNQALAPISDYYRKLGVLKVIDGNQTIEKVWNDLDNFLQTEK